MKTLSKSRLPFLFIASAFFVMSGDAAQIFYESFEDPVADTTPTGWSSARTDKSGMSNAAKTGQTGLQYAYLDDYPIPGLYDGALTTTASILTNVLTAFTRYTLTCDVTGASTSDGIAIDLLAGSTVVATLTNRIITANDFSATGVSMKLIPFSDHPNLGQRLAIRLRMTAGAWDQPCYFDNLALDATGTSGDSTPPSPNPMVWAGHPTQDVDGTITMSATNATDSNLVQYFFTNTVNGHVSGWQDSPVWTDSGLEPGDTYSYKVKARDKSVNLNETAWSSSLSAMCELYIILYESFEIPAVASDIGWSTYPGFNSPGWYGNSCTMRKSGGVITTPFGQQVVDTSYTGGPTGKRAETTGMGEYLSPEYTYTLKFNAGNIQDAAGVQFVAEFIAGTNVLTNLVAESNSDDMSEEFTLAFTNAAFHPNMDQELKIRFYHSDGAQWSSTAVFDNIRLKAVPPPPKATVLMVR